MDCPQCGVRNEPANQACSRCGATLAAAEGTTKTTRIFRNPRRLSSWLQLLLILVIVFELVIAGTQYTSLGSGGTADAIDLIAGLSGIALILAYVGAIVMFCVWTHRANANVHALGAANLRFSPGWAVGWYFVPIANLWKPYQVMNEIWRASRDPSRWQDERSSGIVGWWWFFWIVSNVQVSISTGSEPDMMASTLTPFGMLGLALDLAANACAFLVVKRIGAMQADASERSVSAVFA